MNKHCGIIAIDLLMLDSFVGNKALGNNQGIKTIAGIYSLNAWSNTFT